MEERRFKRRVAVDLRRRASAPVAPLGLKADSVAALRRGPERAALPRCGRRLVLVSQTQAAAQNSTRPVAENHHFWLTSARSRFPASRCRFFDIPNHMKRQGLLRASKAAFGTAPALSIGARVSFRERWGHEKQICIDDWNTDSRRECDGWRPGVGRYPGAGTGTSTARNRSSRKDRSRLRAEPSSSVARISLIARRCFHPAR